MRAMRAYCPTPAPNVPDVTRRWHGHTCNCWPGVPETPTRITSRGLSTTSTIGVLDVHCAGFVESSSDWIVAALRDALPPLDAFTSIVGASEKPLFGFAAEHT